MAAAIKLAEEVLFQAPLGVLELPVTEAPTGSNRRAQVRVQGTFVVEPRDGGPAYQGVDLSFGGLMCTGDAPLWPGNVVPLCLHLGTTRVSLVARVVDLVSLGGGIGIGMRMRFEAVSQDARKKIAAWVSRAA